jgi:predicted PurR-regulated permease PerM
MNELANSGSTSGEGLTAIDQVWSSATAIDLAIRLLLLGLLCYLALIIVRPLSGIIIWSVVLAVALYPVFEWLAAILGGRRKLAAIIVTIVSILIVLGPVAWVAVSLIESLQGFARQLESGELSLALPIETIKNWPLIGQQLYDLLELASTNFTAAFARVAPQLKPLGGSLLSAAGTASTAILTFVASIVIAGFLFTPGPALVGGVKAFARRIILRRGSEFVELAGTTIRKVSRGVIGIAVLQAVLAGIGMVAAHVPAAGFIAFVALVLGIIQIGAGILLVPVVGWSWFALDTTAALLFTAYMVPVGLVDNVLRPVVMGRGLTTPMPVVFIGLIGGVIAYGMIGVFIGPVVLAVAWGLLVAWVQDAEPTTSTITVSANRDGASHPVDQVRIQ